MSDAFGSSCCPAAQTAAAAASSALPQALQRAIALGGQARKGGRSCLLLLPACPGGQACKLTLHHSRPRPAPACPSRSLPGATSACAATGTTADGVGTAVGDAVVSREGDRPPPLSVSQGVAPPIAPVWHPACSEKLLKLLSF